MASRQHLFPAPDPRNGLAFVRDPEKPHSAAEQLARLRLEFAEIYRELYEAAQLQRQLSGPRLLRREGFEIAAEIFPVRHLSGDFYNVTDLGSSALLGIGDIAGKGLLAGMWFTYVLGLTRTQGEAHDDPAVALANINRQMCEAPAAPLTSMFLARLHWESGELLYCNAGHPAPILLRSNGDVEHLNQGGPVLGAVSAARYTSARVKLQPGDTLVGYSDGLIECRNENDEEFGTQRVLNEMVNAAGSVVTEKLFSLIGAARDFAGTIAREDDCSLLLVRRGVAPE
ncbi:MAG: PP2C family protein-serine/threonine phosphatase [Terriglobales bacterium]